MLKYVIITAIAVAFAGSARAERDFEFTKSGNFEGTAVSAIKIEIGIGELSLVKSSDSKIQVDYKNTVRAGNESDAKKLNDKCIYSAELSGDRLLIKVELPRGKHHDQGLISRIVTGDWNDDIHPMLRVSIPDGKSVRLNSASADIEASEVSCNLSIESASSDVSLENTTGDAECDISSGDIDITGHRGMVSIKGASSDLNITDIIGDLNIRTASGDGVLEKIKGAVNLSTASGDCRIHDVDGDLDISSSSGDITVSDVSGSVRTRTVSGNTRLSSLYAPQGDFDVESISGDVQIQVSRDFEGQIAVRSLSGSIDSHLPAEIQKYSNSQLRGTIGNGKGRIDVSTTSGDIGIDRF
jgi:hypothetical protein